MSKDETDTVLELRIHGVNNTPPHQMLDVPNEDVARAFGDDLGSFWHVTPEAVEQGRTDRVQGVSRGVVDPSEPPRGRVPSGIHREAYSWGGMVRTTPPDTSFGGKFVAGVARAAWTFLLPFSIANAAIWSWRLPSPAGGTKIRYGSGMIRVACLTLTVIFVLAIASVGIDLLALQCFRGRATVCPPLSETLEVFAAWKDERRVALFSLLPIVALLVVYFVSTVTTLRYNVAGRILTTKADTAERPLLAEPRFWQSRRETHRLALLHLTAGVATVALLLSFSFASISMLTGLFLAGAAIVVLLIAAGLTALTDSTPYERIEAAPRLPGFMLGLAVALYALPALPRAGLPRRDPARPEVHRGRLRPGARRRRRHRPGADRDGVAASGSPTRGARLERARCGRLPHDRPCHQPHPRRARQCPRRGLAQWAGSREPPRPTVSGVQRRQLLAPRDHGRNLLRALPRNHPGGGDRRDHRARRDGPPEAQRRRSSSVVHSSIESTVAA